LKIAGIDPGYSKPCAIAIVNEDEALMFLDTFKHHQASLEIGTAYKVCPFDLVCIEDTYLGQNVASTKKLSLVIGYIKSACHYLQIPVYDMAASAWQNPLPGFHKVQGKDRERLIIKYAYSMIHIAKKNINVDEAAAIHIALKAMRKYKAEEMYKK